MYIYVLEPYKI